MRFPIAWLTLFALAACGQSGAADGIVVLHTGSAYGYFDDCGCRADSTGGLAKRAWVIDSLRGADDRPFLLVDAGDFTGGDNAYGAAMGRVMVEAMTLMEYDAFTLGEWDLNQGTEYVREIVEEAPMKWVHTNYDLVGLEDLGERTSIVEKGGRRIGILGLYNPSILLNPEMRDQVVVEDIVDSARSAVAELRAAGAEVIVALSHLSYRGDRALADEVDGIDLIVSGHGGKSLINAERAGTETWIVAPGSLGRYLGRAELDLGGADEPGVREIRGDLIVMVPSLPNDPRLDPLFERYEEERREMTEREFEARRQSRPPTEESRTTPEAESPEEP